MESNFQRFAHYLPPYLFPEQKERLFDELKDFPKKVNYYLNSHFAEDEMLQGDGWGEVAYYQANTGGEIKVKGIILSNSCDISEENKRAIPMRILFSPLIDLNKYLDRIEKIKGEAAASSVGEAIRKQEITSILYLPESERIKNESIASLDNIVSLPRDFFLKEKPEKLFCLSQSGFYLFVIKLAIHLTRFQEGVTRFDGSS